MKMTFFFSVCRLLLHVQIILIASISCFKPCKALHVSLPTTKSKSSQMSNNLLHVQNSVGAAKLQANDAVLNDQQHQDRSQPNQAIVVGGGPVGLASALILAHQGFNVSVFESSTAQEMKQFDPSKAYLYNVNKRGQAFTTMFPMVHEKLVQRSISSNDAVFVMAPADMTKNITKGNLPTSNDVSYWIPRHEMSLLLWEAVDEHNQIRLEKKKKNDDDESIGMIHFEQGIKCMNVYPNHEENKMSVVLQNVINGEEKVLDGNLVVGADGINSQVRKSIKDNHSTLFKSPSSSPSSSWKYNPKKFHIKKWISPASGLKLKALLLPTKEFTVVDSDGTKQSTEAKDIIAVRGSLNGPLDFLSLGCLPSKSSGDVRPANCITRPNHILWTMREGSEVKSWFIKNFPRVDLEALITDDEWERFAQADGLVFPPCQYCPGLQVSNENGKCGIVLLGDAAHSFSPDIGQGINAGFLDVVQLDEILKKSKAMNQSNRNNLDSVLKAYERVRAPETRALIRIARFGSPYQYNQPLLRDRIGKKLWTANVVLRLLLNKVTFGLFPKAMIMTSQDARLTYRQVARRADIGTWFLRCVILFAGLKFLPWHKALLIRTLP